MDGNVARGRTLRGSRTATSQGFSFHQQDKLKCCDRKIVLINCDWPTLKEHSLAESEEGEGHERHAEEHCVGGHTVALVVAVCCVTLHKTPKTCEKVVTASVGLA